MAVPCFWQSHVQANDLSSHLYSAWLITQVADGHLPGLYVQPQTTNVLFDMLLSALLPRFGPLIAERAAVTILVETLFWGWFAFVSVSAGRPAWNLVPFLFMISYGAVFRLGLMNFYLSVGLSLWAVVLARRFRNAALLLALPALVAAFAAHAMPAAWGVLVIAYFYAAERFERWRWWILAACLAGLISAAIVLAAQFPTSWNRQFRAASIFGADQLLTYGWTYKTLAAALFCLGVLQLIRLFERSRSLAGQPLFGLWVISAAACVVLPDAVKLPAHDGTLGFIAIRLSLLAAVPFMAVIAAVRWGRIETAVAVVMAACFFSLSYLDERRINALEENVAAAVAGLPRGTRVLSSLTDSGMSIPALNHLASRPCIGRCFDFGHYEPATRQFRLRAQDPNEFVISDMNDIRALDRGEYVFSRADLTVFRLFPCSPPAARICAAPLRSGEAVTKVDLASPR